MAKFIKTDYGTERDEVSQYLNLTRGNNQGIFNILDQTSYSDTETPGRIFGGINHLWMSEPLNTIYDGERGLYQTGPLGSYTIKSWVRNLWANFNPDDIDIDYLIEFMDHNIPYNGQEYDKMATIENISTNSQMVPWEVIHQQAAPTMLNKEMIMLDVKDRKFYKIKFLSWTSGNSGGGFSYTRELFTKKKTKFTKKNYSKNTDVVSKYLTLKRGNNKGLFNLNEMESYNESYYGGATHFWISEPIGSAILTISFDINLGGANQEALNPSDWWLVIRGNAYPPNWPQGLTYDGDSNYSTSVKNVDGDTIVSVTITNFNFYISNLTTWGISESVLGQSLIDEIFKNPHMGEIDKATDPSWAIQLRDIANTTVIYNGNNGITFNNFTVTENLPGYYKYNLWDTFNQNSIGVEKFIQDFSAILGNDSPNKPYEIPLFTNIDYDSFTTDQWTSINNLPMMSWAMVNKQNPPSMIGKEMIMLDFSDAVNCINNGYTINSFYKVKFNSWSQENNGGGLEYTRELIKNSLLKRIDTTNNKIPLSTGELQYIPYNSTVSLNFISQNLKDVRNNLFYPNAFNVFDKITRQQLSPSYFVGVYPGDHTKPYGGSIYLVEVDRFSGTDLKEGSLQAQVTRSLNYGGNGTNVFVNLTSIVGNIYDFTFDNPNGRYYIKPSDINESKYSKLISNSNRIKITLYQNESDGTIFNYSGDGKYLALDLVIIKYGDYEYNGEKVPSYKIESVSLAKLPIKQVISIRDPKGFNIGNTIGGFYWRENDHITINLGVIFGFTSIIDNEDSNLALTVNSVRAYPFRFENNYIQYNGTGFMPGEQFLVDYGGGGAYENQLIFKVSHIKPNPTEAGGKKMRGLTSFIQTQFVGDSPFNTDYNYTSGSKFTTLNRALLRYDRYTKKLYSSVTIGDPVNAPNNISDVNISTSNEILVEDLAQNAKIPPVSDFNGDYDLSSNLMTAYIYLSPESMSDFWTSINDISVIGESTYPGEYFTASVFETISLKEIVISNMSIIYDEKYETYSTLKLDFERKLPYDVDLEVYIDLYDSIEVATRDQKSLGHVSIARTPNPIPENYLGVPYDEELDEPYFTDETYNFTLYNSDFLSNIGLNNGDVISSVGFPFHLTETNNSLNVTDEMINSEIFKLAFNIVQTNQSDLSGDVIRSTFTIDGNFDSSILNTFLDKKTGSIRTVNGQRYVFFQIKENFTYTGGNIIIVYYIDGVGDYWSGGYTTSQYNDGVSETPIPYGSEILAASGDNNWNGSTSSNDRSIMASIVLNHLIITGVNQQLNLRTTNGQYSQTYGNIGTTTGYINVSYWDGTSEILGDGTPFDYQGEKPQGLIWFLKDIDGNDNYTDRTFTIISCDQYGNSSGSILGVAVNQNYDIIDFSTLTNLQYLDVSESQITSIDVSGLTNLKTLRFGNTEITSIDVLSLTNLQYLDANGTLITSLNASGLSSLQRLYFAKSQISTVNISGCTGLIQINAHNSQIGSINLSGLTNLQYLDVSSTQITSLNLTGLSNLIDLYCSSLAITSLDLSPVTSLLNLEINDISLTLIDLSPLVNLTYISYQGSLTSLDFSSLINLYRINITNSTNIESLDFSTLVNLNQLSIYNNTALTSINLGDISNITSLTIVNSPLLNPDLSNLISLQSLTIESTGVVSLDLTMFASLSYISLYYNNQLTSVNVSGLSYLYNIYIGYNSSLTSVDLTGLINLFYLTIYNCPVTIIDITRSTYLYSINIESTRITSLDVSQKHYLGFITLRGISTLDSSGFDSIINQLSANNRNYGLLYLPPASRTSASDTAYTNLISRGWSFYN